MRCRSRKIQFICIFGLACSVLWLLYHHVVKPFTNPSGIIPVVIVEEHHEVLSYWFDATKSGILPKGGITVFHVDGHSDEAPPEYVPDLPFFRWPQTELEEDAMKQKNDIFIQMSAMVGFLSRFIWLIPNWVKQEDSWDYFKETVDLGFFQHQPPEPNTSPEPYFCDCRFADPHQSDYTCSYVNYSSKTGDDINMKRRDCSIKARYISESVDESYAYRYLRTKQGIRINMTEPVIWDIDLDYFGCEIPGDELLHAWLTWRVVELIDKKLQRLFCPAQFEHEAKSDTTMKNLIKLFISQCEFEDFDTKCKKPFQDIRKMTEMEITRQWQLTPKMFCAANDLQLRNTWKDIAFIFHHLTLQQLQALLAMGFCFNFSPQTYAIEDELAVQICHGLNAPDSGFVQTFSPTREDVMARLKRLERIMSTLPPPAMVSICRSARDGYVPRKLAIGIEEELIKAIRRSHPSKTFHVTYDEDLLGGKEGRKWYF